VTSYQDALFSLALLRFNKKLFYLFMFSEPISMYIVMPMCCCVIGCQHSTLNRLFGCVFLVWRHHLRKVNKSSVCTFRCLFLQFSYLLMFLNIQIDMIISKTHNQQFTLTTKNSLHITLNAVKHNSHLLFGERSSLLEWKSRLFELYTDCRWMGPTQRQK